MPLDKAAIFDIAEQGFRTRVVPVPEWGKGVTVRIRELSAEQFQKVGMDMGSTEGRAQVSRALDITYDVVVWCVVDDEGKPVFAEGDQKALKERGKTGSFYSGLASVANAVYDLSGLGKEDEDESPN